MNTLSKRVKRLAAVALALMIVPISSCSSGDGPNESVYLFVINGYTAGGTISLFGPRGPVVQNLKFGERTPEPVEIDRSTGTDFTLLIDGTPEPLELEYQLYSMYPQETGTLFLKRRSDTSEAAMALYRHVQTISPNCAFTFENGMSLDNRYLTSAANYSWAPEWNYSRIPAGYADEDQIPVITECGPLPLPTRAPIPRDFSFIDNDPWFFKSPCNDPIQPNALCNYFGELDNGEIIAIPPTREYFDCVTQAVSIKQPEGMEPSPFPPADAEVQCPPGDLTWDDVQVDPNSVAECAARKRYPAFLLEPTANESQTWTFVTGTCQQTFRIRNDGTAIAGGFDIIFGPEGDDAKGEHLDGELVTSTVTVPAGSEHFYVMFGRPVNPLVWQWNSGQNFVDLKQYPYFNDQDVRIGDYDDEGDGNP